MELRVERLVGGGGGGANLVHMSGAAWLGCALQFSGVLRIFSNFDVGGPF